MKEKKKNIIPQMFDVRPADASGILDVEKINSVERHIRESGIKKKNSPIKNIFPVTSDVIRSGRFDKLNLERSSSLQGTAAKDQRFAADIKENDAYTSGMQRFSEIFREEKKLKEFHGKGKEVYKKHAVPIVSDDVGNVEKVTVEFLEKKENSYLGEPNYISDYDLEKTDYFEKFKNPQKKKKRDKRKSRDNGQENFSFKDIFFYEKYFKPFSSKKTFFSFAGTAAAVFLVIFGFNFINKGLRVEKAAMENSGKVFASLVSAKSGLERSNFQSAALDFNEACYELEKISKDIDGLGKIAVESSRYIPYFSKLSSGSHLVKAAKDLSRIGSLASENMAILEKIKNPGKIEEKDISYLKIFNDTKSSIDEIAFLLENVQENLELVDVSDIPEDKRNQFIELKKGLPEAGKFLDEFVANEKIFTDILGGNGPRKYLFLFQNNQEMRATGGFIGTYAVLDIFNGRVRNFFVDGIFNPDGQLEDRIVPPAPIQKISANWSMHDSNWFPDFPVSAEKATLFYEKTGGPTVDGVIAITPTVLEKLLKITGPIEMPDYGVTIDENNFMEAIQNEVEYNYDKEKNEPKKIISDLAPVILDKIFNADNFSDIAETMQIFAESLDEKHVLIYSKNWEIEKILSQKGWSGEVLDASKDYLSVINTNINGYKTDGVISEKISHEAKIEADGSIIDTVAISRRHNGGDTDYDFWNKVNADYMRVYVPKGSKLISASGQTREFNSPPLDYDALGYKRDPQVETEEESIIVDEESGTRIYQDAGKTVFANWVYVSPKETVEIKYTYLLPFKLETNFTSKPADAYSLLVQKQSGSIESEFDLQIDYPDFYKMLWKYPDGLNQKNKSFNISSNLKMDKFFGVALSRK